MAAIAEGEKSRRHEVGSRPTRPSRRRASPKPRCSRPWRARASWSRTRNCARRWREGLGTPATRAAIIEGLIFEDYVHRNGREPVPRPRRSRSCSRCATSASLSSARPNSPATGNSSWADGARRTRSRRVLHGPHRRGHAELVVAIKNGDIPDTAFLTLKAPVPEMRRHGAGELSQVPVPGLRFRHSAVSSSSSRRE